MTDNELADLYYKIESQIDPSQPAWLKLKEICNAHVLPPDGPDYRDLAGIYHLALNMLAQHLIAGSHLGNLLNPVQIQQGIVNMIAARAQDLYRKLDCRDKIKFSFSVTADPWSWAVEAHNVMPQTQKADPENN